MIQHARADLQAFLDTWRSDGLDTAGRQYLTSSGAPSGASSTPRLVTGKVTAVRLATWRSADDFTLMVDLDLYFDGDPGAWTNGRNTRFVSATRASASAPFRLELATGP